MHRQTGNTEPGVRIAGGSDRLRAGVVIVWCLLTAAVAVSGCAAATPSESSAAGGTADRAVAPDGRQAAGKSAEGAGGSKDGADAGPARVPDVTVRSIIRTADLVVRAKSAQAAADRATVLARSTDGYVASQQSVTDPEVEGPGPSSVNLVLRVPTDDFDRVVRGLRALGTVRSDKRDATDVTEEVVDVESRVKSQKRSIERLRTLLSKATTVGEVVQVESELASRETELESLQTRFAALSSQAALSTIRVTFETPSTAAATEEGGGFVAGLRAGWNAFVAVVQGLLTAVGALVPFLVALGLLVGLPGWLFLRARARRRAASSEGTPSTT